MKRIYLFGGGAFLKNRIDEIKSLPETAVMGIVDNNPSLQGTDISGFRVYDPGCLIDCAFDYVVITSTLLSIVEDLRQMGIDGEKIKTYAQYFGMCNKGKYRYFCPQKKDTIQKNKTVIIMTSHIGYHGSMMAGNYLSDVLQSQGCELIVVAPKGKPLTIDYLNEQGVTVYIYPNLLFESCSQMTWLPKCDVIIFNTYLMYNCISGMSSNIPAFWWLHESENEYIRDIQLYGNNQFKLPGNVKVLCVSRRAQLSFNKYYPSISSGIMEYGIPDVYTDTQIDPDPERIIIGIIGAVIEIKGQDILLEAVSLLEHDIQKKVEVLVIGGIGDTQFTRRIKKMANNLPMVKIMGDVSHDELMRIYSDLDVIVCASRQDSLPISVSEGLMMGKVCIVSDAIGTIDYVNNGEDVLTFSSENCRELADRLQEVINTPDLMKKLSANARKVYEKYFTMTEFKKRVEREVLR